MHIHRHARRVLYGTIMSNRLQHEFERLRQRLRMLIAVQGASWLLAVLLGTVLVAGLADWLLHLDDPGVRIILAVAIVGCTGFVAWRHLLAPLRVRVSDRDLALRIEERYPAWNDGLASSVEFLEAGADPGRGSVALQERVIARTLNRLDEREFHDVLETQPVRVAAIVAGATCLVAAAIVGFNRAEAATALARLAFPLGNHPWPRATDLRIVNDMLEVLESTEEDPFRLARGDTLQLYVINVAGHGELPPRVQLQTRAPGGDVISETLPFGSLRDHAGETRDVGVISLVVKQPLEFRAVGGDDEDMPWLPLDVVPPPTVESLAVTLTPPKYSGRPVQKLSQGVGHVEGLIGTRVNLRARVNKPLASAALRIKDKPQPGTKLAEDGGSLTASFVIREPGVYSYWLDLKDRQGFENSAAPRYEIRGVADAVPEVAIEQPATDLTVTAAAEVALATLARDDLGVKEIRLQFQATVGSQEVARTIELFGGKERPAQQRVEYLWKLAESFAAAETPPLPLGTRIVFHTEATDDYDLGEPHVGRSLTRTLTVVTSEEKLQEIADRQAGLFGELEQTANQQTEAHSRVAELRVQLETAGQLRREDLDLLQQVEMQQRNIAAELQDPADGAAVRMRQLLEEFQHNHLEEAETRRQLQQIADELQRLAADHLPELEQQLSDVRTALSPDAKEAKGKQPQSKAKPEPKKQKTPAVEKPADAEKKPSDKSPDAPQAALEQVARHQLAVRDALQELLADLSEWRDQRDLAHDLGAIRSAQEQLREQTAAVGRQTVTKPLDQLTPQQQADLARLAERQQQQADRLQEAQGRLNDLLEREQEAGANSDQNLQDAAEHLQRTAPAAQMQDAARDIAANNVGRAAEEQAEILRKLQEAEETLRNQGETDTEALVKKLQQTEAELGQVQQEQEQLLKKAQDAAQLQDQAAREQELEQLRKQQHELRQRAEETVRRLQRLKQEEAGAAARRAAERMQQAEGELQEGRGDDAAGQQQEALDDLEQSRRELAKKRREAEEKLAFEQLERIADQLRGMIPRQQSLLEETVRLDKLRSERGSLTRGQLRSLRDLAEAETVLQEETNRLAESLSAAEVFALALRGAARSMETAARLLTEKQTGPEAQQAESAAVKRFNDLIASLDEAAKAAGQRAQPQPEGQEGEQKNLPPTDGIPTLAELEMLVKLQRELLARTEELSRRQGPNGSIAAADQQELERLAEDQAALADLARNMSRLASGAQDEPVEKDEAQSDQPEGPPDEEGKP